MSTTKHQHRRHVTKITVLDVTATHTHPSEEIKKGIQAQTEALLTSRSACPKSFVILTITPHSDDW